MRDRRFIELISLVSSRLAEYGQDTDGSKQVNIGLIVDYCLCPLPHCGSHRTLITHMENFKRTYT